MNIRPKTFVAVCNFSCAGQRFKAGDLVPASVALSSALRFGDRFVTVKRTRSRTGSPTPPAPPSVPSTNPPESGGDVDNEQES